eukprot:15118557-Ditylum_brightwellii.AAC.1
MEAQWILLLHKYLQIIDGSIGVDNTYVPSLQQKRDDYIMDLLLESGYNASRSNIGGWSNIRSSVTCGTTVSGKQ